MPQSEGEIYIKVVTDAKTLDDLRLGLKKAKADLSGAVLGSPEWKAAADRVNSFNTALKQANPNFAAYNQHVRQARTEKRALNFAIVELLHGFDGLVVAIGAATGKNAAYIKSMQDVTGAITQAAGAGFGMKFALDFAGVPAKVAGPIALITTALTALADVYLKLGQKAEEAKKKLQEANKEAAGIFEEGLAGYSIGQARTLLGRYQSNLEFAAATRATTPSFVTTAAGLKVENPAIPEMDREIARYQVLIRAVTDYIEKKKTEEDIRLREHTEGISQDTLDAAEATKIQAQNQDRLNGLLEKADKLRKERLDYAAKKRRDAKNLIEPESSDPEAQTKAMSRYVSILANGFDAVGQSIEVQLIGKLSQATSVFQIFTNAVISGLIRIASQLAAQQLFSSLLSVLGIVSAPITGGASLALSAVGNATTSMASSGQQGRFTPTAVGSTQIQVIPIATSTQLAVMVKSGQRIYNKTSR